MELMTESVGILLALRIGDLRNTVIHRNADKQCVYFSTSAADWRRSLVCFHNHCLFYVSITALTEPVRHIHCIRPRVRPKQYLAVCLVMFMSLIWSSICLILLHLWCLFMSGEKPERS